MLESHANISILLSGVGLRERTSAAARMRAKQTERKICIFYVKYAFYDSSNCKGTNTVLITKLRWVNVHFL